MYRPMTTADLLRKFHGDEDYVERVKEDCVAKKQMTKDPLAPHDESKHKYWILDDEHLKVKSGMSVSTALSASADVDRDTAAALAGAGGAFASAQISQGFGAPADFFESADMSGSASTQPVAKAGRAAKAAAKASAKAKAAPPANDGDAMLAKLAKASGEARQRALHLSRAEASDTLVKQITGAADALEDQYRSLSAMIANRSSHADMEPYIAKGMELLSYYDKKKQYANALIAVSKRRPTTT